MEGDRINSILESHVTKKPNIWLLFGKNIHLEVRLWWRLVVELIIVVLVFSAIIIDCTLVHSKFTTDLSIANSVHFYTGKSIGDFRSLGLHFGANRLHNTFKLAYAPVTNFTQALMNNTAESLKLTELVPYQTELEMEYNFDGRFILAGVYFENLDDIEGVPRHLSVTLRMPAMFRKEYTPSLLSRFWLLRCSGVIDNEDFEDNEKQVDVYMQEAFLTIQHYIYLEWVKMLKPDAQIGNVTIKSFRYNIDRQSCVTTNKTVIPPFICYFAFLLPFINLIRKYGREIEDQILTHHWKYGYQHMTHWWAHFIVSYVRFLCHTLLIYALTRIRYHSYTDYLHYPNTSSTTLIVFLFLHNALIIIAAIVMVNIFRTVRTAILMSLLIWSISMGLFVTEIYYLENAFGPIVYFACFISTLNVFPIVIYIVNEMDDYNELTTLLYVMVLLIISRLILFMIMQFLRNDPYLEHKPINLFCLFERYKVKKVNKHVNGSIYGDDDRSAAFKRWHFEFESSSFVQIVQLKNITSFKRKKKTQQLKNISLKCYKGEITAIVGHHSAGKTTLLRIIAGMRVPNMGSVLYEGVHILEEWPLVRHKVDFNFSAIPLYNYFTVEENLVYYLRIKMMEKNPQRLLMEVIKWIEAMSPIIPDKNEFVKDLTYEQKRILMLCCVLSCRTRILILDEPTLHMCTKAQHLYWDILRKNKPDKAIIFSTIYMDEAEAIADRIGILHVGILKAYGTPFFLRTQYATGSNFIILKEKDKPETEITKLIQKFIPDIKPLYIVDDQLIYNIDNGQRGIFQNMLIHLESKSEELGIKKLSITTKSLNDIYSDIGKNKTQQILPENNQELSIVHKSKQKRRQMQFTAIIFKKRKQLMRNFFQIIGFSIPLIMILIFTFVTDKLSRASQVNKELLLGLDPNSTDLLRLLKTSEYNFIEIKNLNLGDNGITETSILYDIRSLYYGFTDYEAYSRKSLTVFNRIGALKFSNNSYTCYINQHIFHSAPIILNLQHNMMLRNIFGNDTEGLFTTIKNKPMPMPMGVGLKRFDTKRVRFIGPIIFGLMSPIVISSFIIPILNEKRNGILFIQKLNGMNMFIYYATSLLWDLLTYLTTMIIIMIIVLVWGILWLNFTGILIALLIFILYGISGLGMTYCMGIILNCSGIHGYIISSAVHVITGLGFMIFNWHVLNIHLHFSIFANIFPTFSLVESLGTIFAIASSRKYCDKQCSLVEGCTEENLCYLVPLCCREPYFDFSEAGISIPISFLILTAIFFYFIILWLVLHSKEKFHAIRNFNDLYTKCYQYDDEDVKAARIRIAEMDGHQIRQLRYVVDQLELEIPKTTNALTTLSFSTDRGTCVAIYGGHHSGKTNLIRKLVGCDGFNFGDIYFKGIPVKRDLEKFHENVGFCPQYPALIDIFTPRELMRYINMIRGIPKSTGESRIAELSKYLDMGKIMDRKISCLRYESKHKINVAFTILSYNRILFFDEPTRGLGSSLKRDIWNLLIYLRSCGKVIIITTSDSLEAQVLANTVLLVENGEIWAMGSANYIINKYNAGFYLDIKLNKDGTSAVEIQKNLFQDIENLNRFVTYFHEDSEFISRNDDCFKYYVPVANVSFASLYGSLEKNKVRLNINDYMISILTFPELMLIKRKQRLHLNVSD